jgi:hypothetical protein
MVEVHALKSGHLLRHLCCPTMSVPEYGWERLAAEPDVAVNVMQQRLQLGSVLGSDSDLTGCLLQAALNWQWKDLLHDADF